MSSTGVQDRAPERSCDGLIRLFGLRTPAAGSFRGLALAAFDVVPGARGLLARHAMGLGGRLTRLVRGLPP